MEPDKNANIKVIIGLTLIHFTGDFYNAFINPLLPVFVDKFTLTLTQVGLITGTSRFFAFIVQPTVGYLADRYRTRFFILGGPLLAIVFISLVGIAPGFLVLLSFIAIGSIGSAMFHPSVAGMVSTYAGRHLGFSMSIFNMGGTLAFGIGPLFITSIVGMYGLGATPYTMILGLMLMVLLFRIIPSPQGEGLRDLGFIRSLKEILGGVWKSIALIWVVMVLRAYVGVSFRTFIPVLYAQKGYSLVAIGTVVSLLSVSGAFSGLLAGHLADRIGYKPVFYSAHALSMPSLIVLLYAPGSWVYASAAIAGLFIMATLPLGVAMAQELAPRGRSMVSSLMMGLAFGMGGMMAPITGKLADIFSIPSTLLALAIIPLLTIGLVRFLPEITNERRAR
ncbi:MAG: MFS transporter [Deltaproteobacteria bacterium]|nr:MFS transporter [Deltaproteobacteria bacterium]MBW2077081.1 MFS transporter [Deltaproteobacteria bacterium]